MAKNKPNESLISNVYREYIESIILLVHAL